LESRHPRRQKKSPAWCSPPSGAPPQRPGGPRHQRCSRPAEEGQDRPEHPPSTIQQAQAVKIHREVATPADEIERPGAPARRGAGRRPPPARCPEWRCRPAQPRSPLPRSRGSRPSDPRRGRPGRDRPAAHHQEASTKTRRNPSSAPERATRRPASPAPGRGLQLASSRAHSSAGTTSRTRNSRQTTAPNDQRLQHPGPQRRGAGALQRDHLGPAAGAGRTGADARDGTGGGAVAVADCSQLGIGDAVATAGRDGVAQGRG